jgi:hypothetical protein
MCIICKMGSMTDAMIAGDFLSEYSSAQRHMQKAADLMLECSRRVGDAADRENYDRVHKALVRRIREWNCLEHEREHGPKKHAGAYGQSEDRK